ncbi:MAG: polysaccharide deacetylase family protein [Xanthomonadales bacterium]|nr:polysaccharide deacetylase family protein [Xanthomonadales bacterium]NIX13129.1 polysaccharide deacetylase family protein [Xanthomonadales bacterium]
MSDSWWREAASDPLLSIGNHGWDHAHPDLGYDPGSFLDVNDQEQCELQVVRSADYIEQTAGLRPDLYAYPFGQSSDYLRTRFFPEKSPLHRCRAAFGTRPGAVTRESDRWNLPRFVCGRDWRTPAELLALLEK